MTKAKKCQIFALTGIMALIIFIINIYFLHVINSEPQINKNKPEDHYVAQADIIYSDKNQKFYFIFEQLKKQIFRKNNKHNNSELWNTAKKWIQDGSIYNPSDSNFGSILEALRTSDVIKAENSLKGTQFKLSLKLEENQSVLFKPEWYKRHHIVKGGVYSGKDRHTAEVAAFYLSMILDIRWVPPAVMRKLNIKKEIWDVAGPRTKETMLVRDNKICMYGKCLFCRQNETVCGDSRDEVEGAVILMLEGSLKKYRSPWQRTYNSNKNAEWEYNNNYCSGVKKQLTLMRILDLVDASILDYLLQNGDRHHYETLKDRVVILDNGKGLGNPHKDYNDILAPLYQCCVLRIKTWERLKLLSDGLLSTSLAILTSDEIGAPILTKDHLDALDRRLKIIYKTVEECVNQFGKHIFKEK